jgi:hypothetical protein
MWISVAIAFTVFLGFASIKRGRRGRWTVTPLIVLPILVAACLVYITIQRWRPRKANAVLKRALQTSPRFTDARLSAAEHVRVAELYHYGRHEVPQDTARAMHHYREALAGGETRAHMHVGILLYESSGAADECVAALLRAVGAGHHAALLHLGRVYEFGMIPRHHGDRLIAREIYRIASLCPDADVAREARTRGADIMASGAGDEWVERAAPLPPTVLTDLRRVWNPEASVPGPPQNEFRPRRVEVRPREPPRRRFNRIVEEPVDVEALVFRTPEVRIRNDSQNVHDSTVMAGTDSALRKLADRGYNTDGDTDATVVEMINASSMDSTGKENALRVLRGLGSEKHSRYGKSERDALALVCARIADPVNAENQKVMQDMLAQNLADNVVDGMIMCSSGKINRLTQTLQVLDADQTLADIKPKWAVREEIADNASKVRDNVLGGLTDEERKGYDDDTDPAAAGQMRDALTEQCRRHYVEPGILTEEQLEAELSPFLTEF